MRFQQHFKLKSYHDAGRASEQLSNAALTLTTLRLQRHSLLRRQLLQLLMGISQHSISGVSDIVRRAIESLSIVDDQLQVVHESLHGQILVAVKLGVHRADVHRVIDFVWVCWKFESDVVDRVQEVADVPRSLDVAQHEAKESGLLGCHCGRAELGVGAACDSDGVDAVLAGGLFGSFNFA
jgi:hypothetical protein